MELWSHAASGENEAEADGTDGAAATDVAAIDVATTGPPEVDGSTETEGGDCGRDGE